MQGVGAGDAGGMGQAPVQRESRDGKHTVAVQTDYRDSEAQTDPYTPDYVVKAGEQPAVLSLSNLTYGACARTCPHPRRLCWCMPHQGVASLLPCCVQHAGCPPAWRRWR